MLPGLLGASLLISFLHAAIPSHWLPFVLIGRSRRWGRAKTISVTLIAGGGHVLTTTVLGSIIAFTGMNLFGKLGNVSRLVAGTVLLVFGVVYFIGSRRGHGHHEESNPSLSGKATLISLLLALSFSPCEGMLPIYLVVSEFGWQAFFLASSVLAVGTLLGMLIFVSAAMKGMERLKLGLLEKHEGIVIGGMMVLLGLLVLVFG